MVKESNLYGLPLLAQNPFSTRPLESGEVGKLIGRTALFTQLKNYITLRSSRRVLLVGPLGSGRTSLLRCLVPYCGRAAYISHLSANAPAKALLDTMYMEINDLTAPTRRDEVVKGLVDGMYGFGDKLPMIVIDVPASDMSVLNVALRDTLSVLERLNALVVLVCDYRQRQQLPQELSMAFDEHRIAPFTPSDVVSLVDQRLASVGSMNSDFTLQDANRILEHTDGYPASIIKVLRNAVDQIRMGNEMGVAEPSFDTSARLEVRDGPSTLDQLMTPPYEETLETSHSDVEVDRLEEGLDSPEVEEIIDASIPWNERDAEVFDGEESAFGGLFDLDMGALNDAQELDEPLQPTPFETPIVDASSVQEKPYSPPPTGNFGGLVTRNKGGMGTRFGAPGSDLNPPDQQHKVEMSEGNEYWVAEESPPILVPEEFEEEESAALIYDEVGLMSDDHDISDELLATDDLHVEPTINKEELNESGAINVQDENVLHLISRLVHALEAPSGARSSSSDIINFFESRRKTLVGPKESHPLDKHLLSSLSHSEAYVVSEANERDFSPSDEEILTHLSIKRARLSQISNRLLKGGILQARKVGRHRKYILTQMARAQLEAWGTFQRSDSE